MKRWIVAASMLVCSVAAACPMCKDSIPNGETSAQAGSLPGGFNNSVYLLLLGLFATMGFMAVGIIKGIRSSDQRLHPRKIREDLKSDLLTLLRMKLSSHHVVAPDTADKRPTIIRRGCDD